MLSARICSLKYVFHFARMARILLANRGERSIETITSLDQWSIAIETIEPNGRMTQKTIKKPLKEMVWKLEAENHLMLMVALPKMIFLEKFKGKERWERVIFNPKMYVANFGPLNKAY